MFEIVISVGIVWLVLWVARLQREVERLRIQNVHLLEEVRQTPRRPGLRPPPPVQKEEGRSMEESRPGIGKQAL